MTNLINRFIPYANNIQEHPVYHIELRRLRIKKPLATLLRYTIKQILLIIVPIVLLWLMSVMAIEGSGYARQDHGLKIISYLFFASLAVNVLLDFASMIASINSINSDKTNNNWDLICLTNISQSSIITAKHTITQIRVWQMTTLVIALRVAVILIFSILVCFIPNGFDNAPPIFDLINDFVKNPFEITSGIILFSIVAITYVLEPLWRMRAVTSLGVMISSKISGTVSSMLGGLSAIVFMWITQGLLVLGLYWATYLFDSIIPSANFGAFIIIVLYVGILASVIFAYYKVMGKSALRIAQRLAFLTP